MSNRPFLQSSRCPLCESTTGPASEEISFERIWEELMLQWGATFTPEVIARHTPAPTTTLLECIDCGLQYFSPAIPGDAMFYYELSATSPNFYVAERWDFDEIAQILRPEHTVLDIACGAGAFLGRIQGVVSGAVGIDTNPDAVRQGQAAGVDVRLATLDAFARDHAKAFDVVCALHVIEHLPRTQPFLRTALSCVKPGGRLVVCVPNRDRRNRADFEPLDCPPHHMSRWSVAQLEKLGELLGLPVPRTSVEVLAFRDAKSVVIRAIAKRWSLPILRRGDFAARALARIFFSRQLFALYRLTGLLGRWRMHGLGLLAVYQDAGADAAQSR